MRDSDSTHFLGVCYFIFLNISIKLMQAAVASKHYMASAVQYRTRRRRKACNGDFVYYW